MDKEEQRRVLVDWNATEADYSHAATLHGLIEAQARRTPGAEAVVGGGVRLSYAELDARASRLARHLRRFGVDSEVLVGVFMERSADLVVSLLAVLKGGGAYVPLEPDQPRDRLTFMIADASPAVILTTAELSGRLPPGDVPVVLLDREWSEWSVLEPLDADNFNPTSLAYVMYTSGSTGQPKGVMIEHRSVINQLEWAVRTFKLGPGDRVLQKTPFGFDPSVMQLFAPLICGAGLVMLEPGAHVDPERVRRAIQEERITTISFVPTMLRIFLDSGAAEGCDSIRHVASGGETLTGDLVRLFFEAFGPNVELRNIYGPTEATVNSTSWRCATEGSMDVPIGRPIANTRIYLLDQYGSPVPVGVAGELFIGGVGVARGYLNLPELTAERFVDDPFRPGERIYRTGDQARYRPDGTIEYLGRTDEQVKVRGVRIELGEVGSAIAAHPAVRQAVVVPRQTPQGDATLVAYLVPRVSGEAPTSLEMRAFLTGSLTAVMTPSSFVVLDRIPYTSNGKLDRSALPEPELSQAVYVAPRTELETQLARLFAEALGSPRVGIHDDFFELGGHSLLAVRLLTQIDSELNTRVPLSVMFKGGATIAGMALAIATARTESDDEASTVAIQTTGTTPILFFIHPDEAPLLSLRHILALVGPEQRLLGLLPERDNRRFDPARSIEELAEPILASIRASQPHGPYLLGGFSLGGLLAYEIAGRLESEGEHVAWLGIVDSPAHMFYQRALWRHTPLGFVERLRELGMGRTIKVVRDLVWRRLRKPLVRLHWLPPLGFSYDFDYRGAALLGANYRPRAHAVHMDLFTSSDSVKETSSPTLGWATDHGGVIALHASPGSHFTLLTEEGLRVVAESLTDRLNSIAALGGSAIESHE